jgi:hypothetical protein
MLRRRNLQSFIDKKMGREEMDFRDEVASALSETVIPAANMV